MIYIATNKDSKDVLQHYGVRGMRWGHRRGPHPHLAPDTPTLALPQRTHMINNRSVGSVGHKTTFKSRHASIRPSDTRDLSLPMPNRAGSPNPNSVSDGKNGAGVRHKTKYKPHGASVRVGDQPRDQKPRIPDRPVAKTTLNKGGAGYPGDPRRRNDDSMMRQGSVQYKRTSDSERQTMIDRRDRIVNTGNGSRRERDLRRRRYGR